MTSTNRFVADPDDFVVLQPPLPVVTAAASFQVKKDETLCDDPQRPWALVNDITGDHHCYESEEDAKAAEQDHMDAIRNSGSSAAFQANGHVHNGAMIALIPTDEDAAKLVVPGGEPVEELHCTLAFLGDMDELTDSLIEHAETVARRAAADAEGIIEGHVAGKGTLGSEDPPATVLLLNSEEIDQLKSKVWLELRDNDRQYAEQHKPYMCHLTLGYGTDPAGVELPEEPIRFDRVRLAAGDNILDFPLEVTALTADATKGATMPWTVVENHSGCSTGEPWGVVNEDSGALEGCHASREEAEAQVAALYANEPEANDTEQAAIELSDDDAWLGELVQNYEGTRLDDQWLEGRSAEEVARAKAALEAPPDWLKLSTAERLYLAGRYPTVVAADNALYFLHEENGLPTAESMKVPRLSMEQAEQLSEFVKAMATVGAEAPNAAPWSGTLVVEGVTTGDGREFAPEALGWMDPPLPLRWQKETDHGGDHDVTVAVGVIEAVWRDDDQIKGIGHLDLGNADGAEYHRRLEAGMAVGGISVDVDDIADADVEFVWPEEDQISGEDEEDDILFLLFAMPEKMIFHGGRLRAATLVDIPAFVEAKIGLISDEEFNELAATVRAALPAPADDAEAVTAAAATGYVPPPADAFKDPKFTHKTSIHITDPDENGWRRVYGHAAPWGECHIGIGDQCVMVPREENHPYYQVGEVETSDGSVVPVGQIVIGGGHADTSPATTPWLATQHYDKTSKVVADVAVGNDRHGIWLAGVIRPDADEKDVRALRASGRVSGDWRRIGGKLRMIAMLAVNAGGYPVPRARIASGHVLSLVAVGTGQMGINRGESYTKDDVERMVVERMEAERLTAERKARIAALANRVHT